MTNDREFFAGAGIVVCKPGGESAGGSINIVETAHAKEVSDLIFALKDVFGSDLDYFSKYEFYGRLADAANSQLHVGDDCDAIQRAIVHEACEIASEMGKHLYFAYGSNMDDDQMRFRCHNAVCVGTATLFNYGFELDSAGVATVTGNPGSMVHGVLWLIAESDESSLDIYEGVRSDCYRKAILPVMVGDDESLPALVYVSNRDCHDGETYRMGYLDKIVENARRLGFDEEYIQHLKSR